MRSLFIFICRIFHSDSVRELYSSQGDQPAEFSFHDLLEKTMPVCLISLHCTSIMRCYYLTHRYLCKYTSLWCLYERYQYNSIPSFVVLMSVICAMLQYVS